MSRKSKKKSNKKSFFKKYRKLIIVFLYLIIICFIFKYSKNFVINGNELQLLVDGEYANLKYDIYIENRDLYMSTEDIDNLFNSKTYIEKNSDNVIQIISITDTKILRIKEGENTIEINNAEQKISNTIIQKDQIYYIPISEVIGVYNLELTEYENNTINLERLNNKKETATLKKKTNLKYKDTNISKTVEKLRIGQTVTIIKQDKKWTKVQTENGNVGYIKNNRLNSTKIEREKFDIDEILANNKFTNIKTLKNDDLENDIDKITSNYNSRKEFITNILNTAINDKVDAVEIELKEIENTENYYRFLEELKPYLNEYYIALIVVKTDELDKTRLEQVSNEVI